MCALGATLPLRVINSRWLKWTRHIAWMEEIKNVVEKPLGK
jgi:hypothetical protein